MTIISHSQRLTPDEKIFHLWIELGSLTKVSELMRSEGVVNPKTGKPFSPMTLWTAAMRYVIEHPDVAKPIYDEASGRVIPDEEWDIWRIYKALKVYAYSRSRCLKWGKEHGLYPKYHKIFESKLTTYKIATEGDNSLSNPFQS